MDLFEVVVSLSFPHLHSFLEGIQDQFAPSLHMLLQVGLLILLSNASFEANEGDIAVEALFFEVKDIAFESLLHVYSHITQVLQVFERLLEIDVLLLQLAVTLR